jgi:hypothetical protein
MYSSRRSSLNQDGSPGIKQICGDKLSKSFLSMTGGKSSSSNNKYYTIGITGASGLIGTALQDELSWKDTINGKPIRTVTLT